MSLVKLKASFGQNVDPHNLRNILTLQFEILFGGQIDWNKVKFEQNRGQFLKASSNFTLKKIFLF